VVEALSIVRASGADLWVVQKDTNGPFAETSRVPEDLYRVIRAVPGVREASPVAFQNLQFRVGAKPFRVQLIGYRLGGLGGPSAVVTGRPIVQSHYEMVIGRDARLPVDTELRIGRLIFRIVGLTEGIVSSAGDPVAFVSLQDDPAVILADEPTASLDTERGKAVMNLLRRLGRERDAAIIVVTHDDRMLDGFDRVYRMTDGRIDSGEQIRRPTAAEALVGSAH
jgi:hypothetical protein